MVHNFIRVFRWGKKLRAMWVAWRASQSFWGRSASQMGVMYRGVIRHYFPLHGHLYSTWLERFLFQKGRCNRLFSEVCVCRRRMVRVVYLCVHDLLFVFMSDGLVSGKVGECPSGEVVFERTRLSIWIPVIVNTYKGASICWVSIPNQCSYWLLSLSSSSWSSTFQTLLSPISTFYLTLFHHPSSLLAVA